MTKSLAADQEETAPEDADASAEGEEDGGVMAQAELMQQLTTSAQHVNLGMAMKSQGRYDEAMAEFQSGLAIMEAIPGVEDMLPGQLGIVYDNVGMLLGAQGQVEEALEYCERALHLLQKPEKGEGPQTATCLITLGSLYKKVGQLDRAHEALARALSMLEKLLGSDESPQVGSVLNNLAGLHEMRGELDAAAEMFRRALRVLEKTLGEQHVNYAGTKLNLARVLASSGRNEEARTCYEEGLPLMEAAVGSDHPNVLPYVQDFADLCTELGNHERAATLYKRVLDYERGNDGSELLEAHVQYTMALFQANDEQAKIECAELMASMPDEHHLRATMVLVQQKLEAGSPGGGAGAGQPGPLPT